MSALARVGPVTALDRGVAVALSRAVLATAVPVSIVVGTLLNVINQGKALLSIHRISWFHLALNYAVPYLVATYSAARGVGASSGEQPD